MKVQMQIEVEDSVIIDILTTALEGGSNYWYNLPNLSMVERTPSTFITEDIISYALRGGDPIPVADLEEEGEILGYISKENIEEAIQKFIQEGKGLDPGMDADEADVFFQYLVMGELVFG